MSYSHSNRDASKYMGQDSCSQIFGSEQHARKRRMQKCFVPKHKMLDRLTTYNNKQHLLCLLSKNVSGEAILFSVYFTMWKQDRREQFISSLLYLYHMIKKCLVLAAHEGLCLQNICWCQKKFTSFKLHVTQDLSMMILSRFVFT